MPTIPELRKMVADARRSGRVSPEATEAAVKKVAGRLADATAARTAGYVRDVRGQVSWHDPGTGRFAKAGWSTLKRLLMEAIDGFAEETSRNEPQGTWLTAKGDHLIHYGVRRGEAVKVRYGDARHGILDVNRDGNTVSLKVPWDAFEQRVTRPDAFRVEEPRYVGVISTGGALSGDAPRARITRGGGGLVEAAVDIDPELAPAGTVLWAEPTDATHATVVLPDGSRRKVGWAHFTDATPLESDGPTPGPVEWDNVPMFDAATHRVPTVGETVTHPAGLPDGTVVSTAVMGDHRDRWTVERGKLRGPDGKLYDRADFPTRAGTWRVVAPPGEPVDGRHDLSPIVFDVGTWERSKPWNTTRRALERGDGPSWLRLGVGRGGEEASRHGDFIEVTPGFFRMPERGRRAVLWHEFGHGLDSLTTADGTAFHAYETMLEGPNFAPSKDTPGEMVAEAYALLHTDPQWLADNQPKLFAWVMASADKYGFPVPDRARDTIRSEPGAHLYRSGDTISDLADIRNGTRFEDRTGAVFTKVDGGATTARGAFVSDAYLRGDETSDGTPTLLAEPRTWTVRDDVLSDEWAPTLFSGPPPEPDAAPTTWTLDHVVGSEFQQTYLKEWHDGTPFEGWGFKPSPYEGESHPVGRPLQSMWKGFVASPTTGRDVRGFHRLAADVFGLDTSLLDEITAEHGTARELDLNAPDFELGYMLRDDGWHRGLNADEARKLVRTLHEHTQRMLADVGLDPNDRVLLYRGLGTTRARRWTEAGRPEFIEALPVAAFTTSFETAQRYGGDGGVITVEVRAGDILAAGLLHTNLAGEPDLVDEVNVLSPVDQPGFRVVGYTPPSAPGFDETFPDREAFVDEAKSVASTQLRAPDGYVLEPDDRDGPTPSEMLAVTPEREAAIRAAAWHHGTANPGWRVGDHWVHVGTRAAAEDRVAHPDDPTAGQAEVYDVRLKPDARISPIMWEDNGEISWSPPSDDPNHPLDYIPGGPYDVVPYWNVEEDPGSMSLWVRADALEPVAPDGTRPTIFASRSPADTERVTVAGVTDTVKATLNSRLTVEPDPDVQVDGEHVVVRLPDLPDAATAEQVTDAAVSKLADTLYPTAPTFADRIGIHDWPETKPWEATREQVDNGDFPFIRVNTDLPGTVAARWVATEGVMEVPPHWFDATPDSRRMTLHHEVGHQVAIEIARGDAGELLAPFKRDRRIAVIGRAAAPTVEHKSPFSGMDDWGEHGDFPSEILADAYMELMSGNAGIYLDRAGVPELYDAVQEAAARLGMPTGDRDSRGTLIPDWTETDSDLRWRRKPSHDTQVDVTRTGPRTFAWSMWHQNPDGTERFETGKARSLRKAQEAADEAAAAASSSAAFDITDLDEIVDAPMPPRDASAEFAALVDAADPTDRTALALTTAYTAAGFPDGTTEQVRSATNTSWVGFISDHEQTRGFHRIAARVFGRESRLGNVDRYSFQGDGPADEIGFVESIFDSKVHGFEGDAPADAALQALHEATQQTLRDAGIGPDDTVTVYRGVNQAQYIGWADAHLPDHLDSAPVAAFTTDPAVAEMYGPSGTFTLQVRAGDILSVGAIGTTDGAEILVLAPDTKPGFDVVKFESPNAARFMEANPDRVAFLAATTADGAPVVAFERATAGDLRRIDGAYDAVNPARAMKYDFGVDGFDADTLEALRVLAVGDDRVFSPVSNSTNVPAALVVELPYDITDANVAQAQADARAVIADAIYGKPDHEHAPDAPAREPVRPGPAQDGHETDARPEGRAGRSGAATAADLTELVGFSGNVPHDADPEVKAAAVTVADRFLAADLGDGYRSKVTNVYAPGGTSTVDVTGVIYGPNGEQVGVFDRRFTGALALGHIQTPYTWEEGGFGDPSKFIDNPGGLATGVSVEHYRIELDPAHQGSGVGSRFLAASIDQYRAAGVDQMTTHAVTNPETGYIGAYVWAKAGFDWAEGVGVDDVRAIGYSMLSIDPDSPLGETLATWDGVLTPDFPTPLDVASDPAGRQALLAGGGWYGWIPLSDRAAAIKRAMSTAPPNPVFPDATPHQRALLGRFATEPSTFKTIAEHLGFDKPPTTVDAEEFAAATGWMLAGSDGLDIEQVRARSDVAETPLGEGIPFFGSHGDGAPTAILRPTANVISADSLQPGLDAARAAALATDGPAGAAARAVTENLGRYAAFLGYDAVTTDDGALVLNRSALIIPPTLPRKALRASYEQVAESRGAAWWQREPVSHSGLKAHVRADSVDDVREVIDRLSPLVDSNDIGIKAATAGMLTLLADHDTQHGKGVTVYFPRHADEWATLQAVAAALDGYTPSRGGIPPGSDKPTEGLPEFIGLRHEFDWPGHDVVEPWEYRSLYRRATVDEPAVTPDRIGGYLAGSTDMAAPASEVADVPVSTDLFGTPIPDQRSFEFDLAATPVPRRGVDGPIVGGATPSLFPDQPQQVAFEWNGVPSVDDPEMPTPVPVYRDGMAVTSADYPNLPVGTILTVDRPGINGATVARWYRHDETRWVHIFDPTATPSTAYGRPENPAEGGDTAKIVAIGSDVADSSPGIYAVGDRLHARTAFDLPPHTTFEVTTRDGTRQWFYKRSDGSILMWDKSRHASLVDLTDGQFNEMLAGDLAGAKLIIGGLAPNYTPRTPTEKVDTPPGPPPPLSDALRSLLDGSASHHAAVAAAATIFNGDIGDGYRSETTAALVGSGNTVINGTIIDPDGYTIGKWQRTVHYAHPRRGGQTADGFVTVSHDSFTLNDGYRGKGVGTRFLAATIAAYEQAGVDQVLIAAQSDAMLNGAYTWAKLGFDWSDTFIETGGVQGLGRAILDAEPGSPIGRLLAEAVSVDDPDLPTPFDVASDPTGKTVLLGGRDRVAWSGFMPVSERAGKPRQPVISIDTPVDLSAVAAGRTEAPTATLHQSRGGPTISYGDMVWAAPSGTDDWDAAYTEWTGYEGNWGMRRASAALLGMPAPESYGDDVGAPEVHDIVASGVSAGHPEWAARQARARIGYAVTAMNAVYDGALSERSVYRGMADVPPDAPIMHLAAGDKVDMPLSAFTPNAAAADHYMIPNGGTASDIGNGSVLVKLRPGAAVAKATDDYVDGWVDPDTGDFVQDVAEYITYGQFEVVDISTDNRGVRVIELTHKAVPHPLWPDHNLGEPPPPDPVPATETPADPLADLYDYAAELGIDVWLTRNPHTGVVSLDKIVVPKEARKGGIGSQFMDRLVERADAEGVTLSLTPSTDYGATSKARLEKFYRRFGFKKNGGRHPEISDSMVRKPDPNFVPDTQRVDFPEATMASPVERPEWADGEFVSKTGATYFVVTEPKSVTMRTADGTLVGYVNWGDDSVIGNMNVVDAYQRQGVATELLRRGRIVEPQLEHSDRLSDDATKWLDAIGESPATTTPTSQVPAPVAHPGSWPSDPTTPTLPASLVSMPGSGRPVKLSVESDSFSGQTNGTVVLADAATGARVGHLSYTAYAGRTTVTSVSVDPAVASEPVADTMLGYAIANDPGTVFESNLTDAAGLAWWRDAKQSFPTANIAARPQQTPFVQSTTDLMDRIHDGPTVDDRATATRAAETLFNLGLGNGWQTTVSNVEPVRSDKRSGAGIKVSGEVFNGATTTGTWSAVISTVGADPYSEATLAEQAAGLTVTLTDLSSNAVGSRLAASQIITGLVDRFAETGVEQFDISGGAPQAVRTIAAKAGWQWVDVASVPDSQKQTVFDAIRGVRDAIPESMWTDTNIDNDALNDMSSLFGQWDGESELPTPFDVETLAPGVVGRSDAPMTISVAVVHPATPPVASHAAPSGREALPAEIAGFLPETQFRLSSMPDVTFGVNHEGNVYSVDDPFVGSSPAADVAALVANVGATVTVEREPSIPKIETAPELGSGRPKFGTGGWDELAANAFSAGRVTREQLAELGMTDSQLKSMARRVSGGKADDWTPLPDRLWHVTTAADLVETEGLKRRADTGQGGLGGSHTHISMASDLGHAEAIYDGLREAVSVARGDVTARRLVNRAIAGDLGSAPFADDRMFVAEVRRVTGVDDWTPGDAVPDLPPDRTLDLWRRFAYSRMKAGGPRDPLVLTDADVLAKVDLDQVAIMEFAPNGATYGTQLGLDAASADAGEWRLASGEAVKLVRRVPRAKAAWETADQAAPQPWKADDISGGGSTVNGVTDMFGPNPTSDAIIDAMKVVAYRSEADPGGAPPTVMAVGAKGYRWEAQIASTVDMLRTESMDPGSVRIFDIGDPELPEVIQAVFESNYGVAFELADMRMNEWSEPETGISPVMDLAAQQMLGRSERIIESVFDGADTIHVAHNQGTGLLERVPAGTEGAFELPRSATLRGVMRDDVAHLDMPAYQRRAITGETFDWSALDAASMPSARVAALAAQRAKLLSMLPGGDGESHRWFPTQQGMLERMTAGEPSVADQEALASHALVSEFGSRARALIADIADTAWKRRMRRSSAYLDALTDQNVMLPEAESARIRSGLSRLFRDPDTFEPFDGVDAEGITAAFQESQHGQRVSKVYRTASGHVMIDFITPPGSYPEHVGVGINPDTGEFWMSHVANGSVRYTTMGTLPDRARAAARAFTDATSARWDEHASTRDLWRSSVLQAHRKVFTDMGIDMSDFEDIVVDGGGEVGTLTDLPSSSPVAITARTGLDVYPRAWRERLAGMRLNFTLNRGDAAVGEGSAVVRKLRDAATADIVVPDVNDAPWYADIVGHEFGHIMQSVVPGIRSAEMWHILSRVTPGEKPVRRKYAGQTVDFLEDHFVDPYTGRLYNSPEMNDYGFGPIGSFEVFTTGVQGLYDTGHRAAAKFNADPQLRDFTIGVMASVHVPAAADVVDVAAESLADFGYNADLRDAPNVDDEETGWTLPDDLPHLLDAPDTETAVAQTRRALAAAAESAVSDGLVIRVPPRVLDRILGSGAVLPQTETGQSEGMFNPDRRSRWERNAFGIPGTFEGPRPVYAMVASPNLTTSTGDHYGLVGLRLKPEVAGRATFSLGDSLDMTAPVGFGDIDTASPAEIAATVGVEGPDVIHAANNGSMLDGHYVEAQIHGGVPVGDIASVISYGTPTSEIRGFAEALGVPVQVVPTGNPALTYGEVARADQTALQLLGGTYTVEDIRALLRSGDLTAVQRAALHEMLAGLGAEPSQAR